MSRPRVEWTYTSRGYTTLVKHISYAFTCEHLVTYTVLKHAPSAPANALPNGVSC